MERVKTTKWIKHYNSDQKILLVGEGDFSFAASLATSFGDASNIVATSLDSKEELRYKHSEAMANLERLESLGCVVIHQVNAHTMSKHPFLRNKLFDRIVFNFPHATLLRKESDPLQIRDHQVLVKGFLRSARELMGRGGGGEVHVTLKTCYPYSDWKIHLLAPDIGLQLVEAPSFSRLDYPRYFNRRGRTFVFRTIQWPDDQVVSRACWDCDHRNNMLGYRHDVTSPASTVPSGLTSISSTHHHQLLRYGLWIPGPTSSSFGLSQLQTLTSCSRISCWKFTTGRSSSSGATGRSPLFGNSILGKNINKHRLMS